ncbi:hypothetical protein Y032_0005g2602 [Ancylostoma ceylanicum]|uniref:CCHC-type domain-containing protein n=1 Tax=Ancylostoma ceylanicum TaxID=53326 RepID=A0A016VSG1_9BILA|nr:hypothetical protein Y032_0005g2602 [Ancylostoma ceylanicum]
MAKQTHPQELDKFANLHHATRDTIESEITSAIDDIISRTKLAGVADASWTHHLMLHTSSEAGAGAQALQLCRLIRDATIARESILRFTERYLSLQSRLQYEALQGKFRSMLTNIKEENIKEKVVETLKKLDGNIEEMQQELNRLEGLVNMETSCMRDIKSMIRTMDQKVKTFAPLTPQHEPLERSPEHSSEQGVATESVVPEEPRQEQPKTSEEKGQDPDLTTDNRVPLTDDEYMEWLVKHNSVPEEDTSDKASHHSEEEEEEPVSVPPKQIRRDLLPEPAKDEQQQLKRDLNNLLYGLHLLPKRKIGESSEGVAPHIRCTFCGQDGLHYSDSCPHITDGDDRWHFVREQGLYPHCLERCDPRRDCCSKKKKCWYCSVVENTILRYLIPKDGAHHRAFCNIPDSGGKIRERIQEIKRKLNNH